MKTEQDIFPGSGADSAAQWARRCAAGLSSTEQAEFKAWLAADPKNPGALRRANHLGVDCDWAWQAGAVEEIKAGIAVRVRRRRHRRAVAAGAAAVVVATALLWELARPTARENAAPPVSNLVIIRPAIKALPDGSIVELKDDALVTADFSGAQRAVSLSRGTAHFQVTKDPKRPFVVKAGGLSVQAVGTAFTVEINPSELKVVVTEGTVHVDPTRDAAPPKTSGADSFVALVAGRSAVFSLDSSAGLHTRALDDAELQQQLEWRMTKLEFTRTPLREVIAQMNQHNRRKLVLGDDAAGEVRISGVLRADKIDTLVESLEDDFGVRAERNEDRIILRLGN